MERRGDAHRSIGNHGKIRTFRTRRLTVRRKQPTITHIDGEPTEFPSELDIRCHQGALRVFVPHRKLRFIPVITPAILTFREWGIVATRIFRKSPGSDSAIPFYLLTADETHSYSTYSHRSVAARSLHRHPYALALERAQRVMDSRPDSALAILDSINPDSLTSTEHKARYAVLAAQASFKNKIIPTDDSLPE